MNLYEKVATTEPGSFAHMLGQLMYDHGTALKEGSEYTEKLYCPNRYETWHKQLTKLRHYLESLAHTELAALAAEQCEWVAELATRERIAGPTQQREGSGSDD